MVTAGGLRRRTGSRFPSLGREFGCGDLMVAEGAGYDRGGHLQDVLADRGGPAGDGGNAEVIDQRREGVGVHRLAGPAPGTASVSCGSSQCSARVLVSSPIQLS